MARRVNQPAAFAVTSGFAKVPANLSCAMPGRLILMLKFPVPGTVKTRLIPALGAERACALHRALVAHTLAEVAAGAARAGISVEVRVGGAPDEGAARAWLGEGFDIRGQGEGELGARLDRAVAAAFAEDAGGVVVIGGDCPDLTTGHIAAAFAALERHDVVLGPATDGGYYLIGLRRPQPALFQGIRWGGETVLAQTVAAAQKSAMSVVQLTPLGDVDEPRDLALWARTAAARKVGRGGVSVVMPVKNEARALPDTLAAVAAGTPFETIVVDAGSTDRSAGVARVHGAIVIPGATGRAAQMNAGAAIATGEYLFFLHADTLPPADFVALIRKSLAQPGVVAGAFAFTLDADFPGRRWIERGTNWRAKTRQMPYGDQGLFLRRDVFFEMGGFPDMPILEDYELVRRLRRRGRIAVATPPVRTSARRWLARGALRTTLLNQGIVLGYRLGIPPARLAAWYRGNKPRSTPIPSTA
jgi:rSAM/selenodomain-associated transferase 2/rSAM/selenodomain-associated transferase 1